MKRITRKNNAFTLAEILIILAIIGVVAALTIPPLVQSYKKHVVETKLKHFYSMINQALNLAESDFGPKTNWIIVHATDMINYIKPYIKYTKIETTGFNETEESAIYFPNGSMVITTGHEFFFFPNAKDYDKDLDNKQNLGRKNFRFAYYGDRADDAFKYHRNKGVEPYMAGWDGDIKSLTTAKYFGCNSEETNIHAASYCTAIIQRNSWKIPKDYPFKF